MVSALGAYFLHRVMFAVEPLISTSCELCPIFVHLEKRWYVDIWTSFFWYYCTKITLDIFVGFLEELKFGEFAAGAERKS